MNTKTKTAKSATSATAKKIVTKVQEGTNKMTKKFLKLTVLFWKNPKTGNLVGYNRAHNLKLVSNLKAVCGIYNEKTERLVSINRAKQLGLLTPKMLKHAA